MVPRVIRSIIYPPCVEASPLRTGTTSPAIGAFSRLKERIIHSSLSRRQGQDRGPYIHVHATHEGERAHAHTQRTLCSMCYNKSTILLPTRDDSIGTERLAWFLSENHASPLHVSNTMHQSSSGRPRQHVTLPRPPFLSSAACSWLETTGLTGDGEPLGASTSTYGTAAFERDRTGAKWIWQLDPVEPLGRFFNLSIISEDERRGMRCDSRAFPLPPPPLPLTPRPVDISTASGDGNLKEIRGVPQLASFSPEWREIDTLITKDNRY